VESLYLGVVLAGGVTTTAVFSYLQNRKASNLMESFKGMMPPPRSSASVTVLPTKSPPRTSSVVTSSRSRAVTRSLPTCACACLLR
jgi:hypothetical protein